MQILSGRRSKQRQSEFNLAVTLVSIVFMHILCNALRVFLGVLVVVLVGKLIAPKYIVSIICLQTCRWSVSGMLTITFLHSGSCVSSPWHISLSCSTSHQTFSFTVQSATSSNQLSVKSVESSAEKVDRINIYYTSFLIHMNSGGVSLTEPSEYYSVATNTGTMILKSFEI